MKHYREISSDDKYDDFHLEDPHRYFHLVMRSIIGILMFMGIALVFRAFLD